MSKYYILFGSDGVLVTRLIDNKDVIPPEAVEVEYDFWVRTIQEDDGIWRLNEDGTITKHPRPEYVPTPEEVLASQSAILQRANQLAAAQKTALTNRIGVLQDAIDLEMATPEEEAELAPRQAQLLAWKKYAILLGRVTTQAGWYQTVEWPAQPADGMDLTVSAARPTQAL